MTRSATYRWPAALVLAVGLLSACGTTVPNAQNVQGGGLSPDGTSLTGTTSTTGSAPAGPDGALPGSSVVGGTTGTAGTTSGSQPLPSAGSVDQSQLPGVQIPSGLKRGAPVEVGFEVADPTTTTAFLKAVGVSGTVYDQKVYVEALVQDINTHGGLAGHPVKPVYYVLRPTRTDPYTTFMSEMCALWTQDHHVVAAFTNANLDWSPLAHCLSQKHAVFSMFGAWVRDRKDYAKAPYWFDPDMLSTQALAPAYVDVPARLGYFGKGAKVGLLDYDYQESQALGATVTQELAARGIKVAATETIHMGTSTPDLSSTIQQAQAAVLKFRAVGVTHVMSVAYPGAVLFFMEQAEGQGYHPRYALTSYEGLVAIAANAPAAQLKGAVGVGFLPDADVDAVNRPPYNAAARSCTKLFTSNGLNKEGAAAGFVFCDFARMIQAGAAAGGQDQRHVDWLARGIESSGTRFQSAVGFASSLSPTKHDSLSALQGLLFDGSCTCWKYQGRPQHVS